MFGAHPILALYRFLQTRHCQYIILMTTEFTLPDLRVFDSFSRGYLGEHAKEYIKQSEIGDYSPGTPGIGDEIYTLRRVGQYQ